VSIISNGRSMVRSSGPRFPRCLELHRLLFVRFEPWNNPKLIAPTPCSPAFKDLGVTGNRSRSRDLAMLDDARALMNIRSFNP
jgi:hypothetical protein